MNRRIIFLCVIVVVIYPLYNPIGLPIPISPLTRQLFDYTDALPSGTIIVIDPWMSTGSYPELNPMTVVMLNHLMNLDTKIIIINTHHPETLGIIKDITIPMLDIPTDKVYGEDWVFIGFIPGMELGISSFASNPKGVVTKDGYGGDLTKLPLMQEVTDGSDFDLWIAVGKPDYALRQVQEVYNTPMTCLAPGGGAAEAMPYLASGQLKGVMISTRGAAEYELLLQKPGLAVSGMDATSAVHIFIILGIIIGNIYYVLKQKKIVGNKVLE